MTKTMLAATVTCLFIFQPVLVAQDELSTGYLVVSDRTGQRVIRYDPDTGAFVDFFQDSIALAEFVLMGPDQNLYVSSFANDRVLRYNGSTGALVGPFAIRTGSGLNGPEGLAFGPDGHLYVASFNSDEVKRFDGATGEFVDDFVSAGLGGLDGPLGLLFGPDGALYVGSQHNDRVLRYDGSSGALIGTFVAPGSGGLDAPWGLLFGPDGSLYAASVLSNEILRYDGQTGAFLGAFVSAGSGGLVYPTTFSYGPDRNLYVASSHEDSPRILRYDGQSGAFLDTFVETGSGGLAGPTGVFFHSWEASVDDVAEDSAVATDEDGFRAVVWESSSGDPSGSGLLAQLFDAHGVSAGPPVLVNEETDGDQDEPAVRFGPDGDAVVVWRSEGNGIRARRLGRNGQPRGDEVGVSGPHPGDRDPDVAIDGEGNVGVVWRNEENPGNNGTFLQPLDPDLDPRGSRVPVSPDGSEPPSIDASEDGFVVVWERELGASKTGENPGIFGRFFDPAGNPESDELQIDDGSGEAGRPAVGSDGDGDAVVAWERKLPGSDDGDILVRRLPRGGSPVDPPDRANLPGDGRRESPDVSASPQGGFVVAWASSQSQENPGAVEGRFVGPDGSAERTPFLVVDTDSDETLRRPRVALDADGDVTVSFTRRRGSQEGVQTRVLDRNPSPLGKRRLSVFVAGTGEGSVASDPAGISCTGSCNHLFDEGSTVTLVASPSVGDRFLGWSGACSGPGPCSLQLDTDRAATARFAPEALPGCEVPTQLCVGADDRFQFELEWSSDQQGGSGSALAYTLDSGFFYFLNDQNLEFLVKVVDGRALNGHFWVFYAAATDVAFTLTATDRQTGAQRSYSNPQGNFGSNGDLQAFSDSGQTAPVLLPGSNENPAAPATCGGTQALCLGAGDRFRVELVWSFDQQGGTGFPLDYTRDSGFFYFLNDQNLELLVKVIDGRPLNGHFWVFYGAATDVAFTLTVTDTQTGDRKVYTNQQGNFGSFGDVTAF